jgi:hypothetical protein
MQRENVHMIDLTKIHTSVSYYYMTNTHVITNLYRLNRENIVVHGYISYSCGVKHTSFL